MRNKKNMTFSCTKKVLTRLKKHYPTTDEKEEDHFFNWYVDEIAIGRKKYFFFTHSQSLFSFFFYAGTQKEIKQLPTLFRKKLEEVLIREVSSSEELIAKAFPVEDIELVFTKTNSRRILGSMNDYKWQIQVQISHVGRRIPEDQGLIEHILNKCPMKKEGKYVCAKEEMKRLLEER